MAETAKASAKKMSLRRMEVAGNILTKGSMANAGRWVKKVKQLVLQKKSMTFEKISYGFFSKTSCFTFRGV